MAPLQADPPDYLKPHHSTGRCPGEVFFDSGDDPLLLRGRRYRDRKSGESLLAEVADIDPATRLSEAARQCRRIAVPVEVVPIDELGAKAQ